MMGVHEETCEWSIGRGWSNPDCGLSESIDGVLESGARRGRGWPNIAAQKAFYIFRGDDEGSGSSNPAHGHT
jgi:hypothetical protein